MALTELLILRKPRSGCLEERTALIQQCQPPAYFSISLILAAWAGSPLRLST
jgi:hypothetical protein